MSIRHKEPLPWAAETLDRALWQSSSLGLAAWQLMIGALVVWRTPEHQFPLLLLHLGLAALGIRLAWVHRRVAPKVLFFSALMALLATDLALTHDPFVITVLCMTGVIVVTPFLVLPGGWASAMSSVAVVGAAGLSLLDGLGNRIALAISIPVICYSVAAYGISRVLRRFADTVDAADQAATEEHEKLILARTSARTAAEYARTLHDTVINTLAAIAVGGQALTDQERVRRRCAQDAAFIRSLNTSDRPAEEGIEHVGSDLSVSIKWTGVMSSVRRNRIADLAPARRAALRGIIRELLLNIEKHAQTDHAIVDVQMKDRSLVVTITDEGVGFDSVAIGHGLRESVHRRASEAGLSVQIDSETGRGTKATVNCPDVDSTHEELTEKLNLENGAEDIRRSGTWVWCIGLCTASLVSGAIGAGNLGTFASSGLVAVVSLAAWVACRHGGNLPLWLELIVVISVPLAFIFGFIGANFDGGDPAFWQAIGLSPLMVILLNTSRSWISLALAAAALCGAAGGTSWIVWNSLPDAAWIAIAHACIELAQVCVWLIFVKTLSDITVYSNATRKRALRDIAERAALLGASKVQELWREAHLQAAIDLLCEIADGKCSATDPEVQKRAGKEEHSLRQLLNLSPDLKYLGPWLARCLAQSRENDIRLTIRIGEIDLPDDRSARAIGQALTDLLDNITPGTDLVFGYFPARSSPRATVVGPSGFSNCVEFVPGSIYVMQKTKLLAQDLVEIRPSFAV